MIPVFRANGKLLLAGEYFVLDGALALALPTRLGQTLKVETVSQQDTALHWQSVDETGKVWFKMTTLRNLQPLQSSHKKMGERLSKLLIAAFGELPDDKQFSVTMTNDFPRLWGLGSSSTLVSLVAQWSNTNPYPLNEQIFGGSGYDIACAAATSPILYQKTKNEPIVTEVAFKPLFKEAFYFVYLNQKQDSTKAVAQYKKLDSTTKTTTIPKISDLTKAILAADNLIEMETLLLAHERTIAAALQFERAQDLYFSDYWGIIKSLGAWGGDFVLATSNRPAEETLAYFKRKGFATVLRWDDLF